MHDHEPHESAEDQPASGPPDSVSRPPVGGSPIAAGDQMREILSNVGGHLDQLRQVQSELDGQAHLLDERDHALREAEQRLEEDRRAFAVARAAHAEAEEAIARRREEVTAEQEAARREIEETRARIEREEGSLDERRAELERRAADVGERSSGLTQEQEAFDAERDEWVDRQRAIEETRAHAHTELAQREEEIAVREETLAGRGRELAAREQELAGREEELAARAEALTARAGELAARDAELARRGVELAAEREQLAERAQAAEVALAEEREQAAQAVEAALAKEREQAAQAVEAALAEEREQAAQAAEVALAKEREQAAQAASGAVAELTARCAELEASIAEAREGAEHATTEGLEVAQEAESERDRVREQLESALADLQSTSTELEQAALQRDANEARESEARETIAALEKSLNDLETQLADARPEQDVGADVRLRAMQQKIQKLEAETRRAKIQAPERAGDVDEIREKAQHLSRVAAHLRRRQSRLKKARRLLASRKATGRPAAPVKPLVDMDRHAEQTRRLEKMRLDLGNQRASLLKAEKRMVRRWAAGRAIAAVGWMVVLGLVSVGIGWLAADHFVPATISASVTLNPEKKGLDHLGEQEAAEWQAWHQAIVFDDAFVRMLSNRLGERRLDAYSDLTVLRNRLAEDLTFDTTIPNRLTLTLAGTDAKETTALLDLLVTTIVTESSHQLRKRAVKPWAELPAGRPGKTRMEYAVINDVPIDDQRLVYAGPIAGVAFVMLCTLVLFTYRRLVKVKREIDADNTLFDDTPMPREPTVNMIGA